MGNIFSISISCDALLSPCRDCTVREATFICNLGDNLDALQTELEDLVQARNDVMTRVVNAEQQQLRRLNRVQLWLTRVQDMESEVAELRSLTSKQTKTSCLRGCCSKNCKSSYRWGRKVAKMLQAVSALKAAGSFSVVADRIPEASVDERPIESAIVGQASLFDDVWRCLVEEEVGIIGLYGMGGVGKTTLLTQINNKFLNSMNDFDVVIWVVVSKDLQLEKIQESIGKKIGLVNELWKNKSPQDKATEVFNVLRRKKFLLLLDDIWERVELSKIGVPLSPTAASSKVVFTTRLHEVCGRMEAQRKFKVKCLTHDEAWKLFQEKVGDAIHNAHPDILELAETMARQCGGLPLAVITTGRAMSCKYSLREWKYAIQVLTKSVSGFPGMEQEVYPLLKFSYDILPNDTIKSCLLYCSLFPQGYSICKGDLIDYWISEGLLDGYNRSEAQDQGYYFIGILLQACLLEEDDDNVKMHDVIRDMVLWMTNEIEEGKFLVHAGEDITEIPKTGSWGKIKRISFMKNQIENLREPLICPSLETLFLNFNHLKIITRGFFISMHSLKVLNFSNNASLTELPSEISKLISLQHLDISGTAVEELPGELRRLVNLKCLNLDQTPSLRIIPQHLISNFRSLYILRMFDCGFFSLAEDSEFWLEELFHLEQLNVLSITLRSSDVLQRILSSDKLRSCTQSLSLQRFDSESLDVLSLANMKHLEVLHIVFCTHLEELKMNHAGDMLNMKEPHGFISLSRVDIDSCFKLRDLTWLVLAPKLKLVQVSNCHDIEEIICVEKLYEVLEVMGDPSPFDKLEFLKLSYLPNLKSIYGNLLRFPHLKELFVYECPNLKKLPLNSKMVKERNIVIEGEKQWWKELKWDDSGDRFHAKLQPSVSGLAYN